MHKMHAGENFMAYMLYYYYTKKIKSSNINGRDVQRKNVVNNVDKSSLWAP